MSKLLPIQKTLRRSVRMGTMLIFLTSLMIVTRTAYAQEGRISGKITDENGASLPGVSILVKGTTQGTTSDADGAYTLTVSGDDVTLVFSFIGFASQEIPINGKTAVNVAMLPDVESLQEVIVVGYGENSKTKITGAISTVQSDVLEQRANTPNPMAALQGQVPGVIVTRSTGAPGREGWDFQIRGASSVNSAQPLIIVDGIPLINSTALNSMNPNDIESMTFLKDASAAIYGSRAAGGVVLITTKKAKSGKPVIQYDGSVSRKTIGLKPQLLTADEWGPALKTAIENNDVNFKNTDWLWYKYALSYIDKPESGYVDLTTTPNTIGFGDVKDFTYFNTDWQDVLWGSATTTQHNLSLSARTDKMGYRLSLGYLSDGSALQWGENSNKRYNARLTHDFEFSDKFRIETMIAFEKNDIIQPTRIGSVFQYSQPGFPVATKSGKPYGWGTQYTPNWLVELGGENKEYQTRVYTTLKATYDFTEHLSLTGQASYNWNAANISEQGKAISEWYNYAETAISSAANPAQDQGYYQRNLVKDSYYNLNAYFSYNKILASNHEVGGTLGLSYERDEFNAFNTRTRYLANDDVPSLGLGIGDNTTRTNGEQQTHYAVGSYFGRVNYGFKDKYLFETNVRYDGASNFIAENRWELFYGFSGGWRITEENFMQGISFLNELKLRASWGSVGNSAIPRPGETSVIGLYDYIQLLDITSTTGPTANGFPILGASPSVLVRPSSQLVSADRTWERIETSNIGLDFALLNGRLTGSFDYYVKHNRNMLLGQTYSALLGATAPALNIGHLRTNGWEVALGWKDQRGDFGYSVMGTLTDNSNELVDYGGANLKPQGLGSIEGYPINSFFGLEYAGRIQDEETRAAYSALAPKSNVAGGFPLTGLRMGDNMFVDQNGDGKLTQPEDLVYLGRNDPRYTFALNLGFTWKGFDFSAVFQGVGKRTIFRDGTWRVPFGSIFQGQTDHWVGDTWTPENRDAHYPLLSVGTPNNPNFNGYNYQISNWAMEDGAYVRLKNIVLGYTIPAKITQRVKIDRLRIYVSGTDIWESMKIRDGWDPEQTRTISGGFQRYPFYRMANVGVNLTF